MKKKEEETRENSDFNDKTKCQFSRKIEPETSQEKQVAAS